MDNKIVEIETNKLDFDPKTHVFRFVSMMPVTLQQSLRKC